MQKRIALPAAVLIMLLLAAPVAQGLQRHGGIVAGLAAGTGLGFLYFITDGFVLALGEAGAIPPVLAAWTPALIFASLGGAAQIRFGGYGCGCGDRKRTRLNSRHYCAHRMTSPACKNKQ